MTVLALAMHLDPVYLGAHHLMRFLVVSMFCRVGRPTGGKATEATRSEVLIRLTPDASPAELLRRSYSSPAGT